MVKNPTKKVIHFSILILLIGLIKCANQLPPPGGDPDKIPPKIVEVYPADGTTKYDDNYFEIEFSEYVDKRSVTEAIFISPFIEGGLEYNWTGTSLEVKFPDKLKEDVTYSITIGTDVVDLNNKNRMAQAFTFSFSTGDKIDRKIISGKVYGSKTEGIFIYAYKLEENSDSLLKHKPDYVSQTGVDGSFSLQGLGSGNYRVFAVNDNFKDYLFQQDQDEIGIPQQDISLSDIDSVYTDLHLLLFNADTTKPRLISVAMTDRYHLLVGTSKIITHASINSGNFLLVDSTNNNQITVEYAFKGNTKPEEFILMIDEEINPSNEVYLFADSLVDQLGNIMRNDYTKIVISDRIDTSSINIFATEPDAKGSVDYENPEIKIFFDEAFNKDFNFTAVALTDTFNKPISFDIDFYDDATLVVKPAENLKPDKNYLVKLQLIQFIDLAGNSRDSLYTLRFTTISGLDFTGLSGTIINVGSTNFPTLVLENTADTSIKYQQKPNVDKFAFSRIEPGEYLLWCYLDENQDGKYNYGWPQPIEFSESFSFFPDTINLRPRWEVSDVVFRYK